MIWMLIWCYQIQECYFFNEDFPSLKELDSKTGSNLNEHLGVIRYKNVISHRRPKSFKKAEFKDWFWNAQVKAEFKELVREKIKRGNCIHDKNIKIVINDADKNIREAGADKEDVIWNAREN